MNGISVRFDPGADALYVSFRASTDGDVSRTEEIGGGRQVDYHDADEVIGIEFLWVSNGIDLRDVPRADEVAAALRAFPLPSKA